MQLSKVSPARRGRFAKNDETLEIVSIKTSTIEDLKIIRGEDCLYPATVDFVNGENILFVGPTGGGKTVRANALLIGDNYDHLLKGKLDKVKVNVIVKHVNMVIVNSPSELEFEKEITDGTTHKSAVGIAEFIRDHGYHTRGEFELAELEKEEILMGQKGTLTIHALMIDDLDRVQDPVLMNSFMKFLSDQRHILYDGQERYLKLQCIASSNSSVGRPKSMYISAKGIDGAVANRFALRYVPSQNLEAILTEEFPQYTEAVRKLAGFAEKIRVLQQEEGTFSSIGEISMRQLRPRMRQIRDGLITPEEACERLLLGVPHDSEEKVIADNLVAAYLGYGHSKSNRAFGGMW